MYNRILVPIDGSETSEHALDAAWNSLTNTTRNSSRFMWWTCRN